MGLRRAHQNTLESWAPVQVLMVFWLQNHHDWRAMCKTLNILRMFKSRGHEGDTKGTLYFELCLAARVPNFDVSILFDSFIWSWHCFHNAAQRPYNRGFQRHPVSSLCRWLWNDLGNCSNHLWSLDSKPCMCGVVLASPGLHHSSKPLCRLCGEFMSVPEKGRITCSFSLFDWWGLAPDSDTVSWAYKPLQARRYQVYARKYRDTPVTRV